MCGDSSPLNESIFEEFYREEVFTICKDAKKLSKASCNTPVQVNEDSFKNYYINLKQQHDRNQEAFSCKALKFSPSLDQLSKSDINFMDIFKNTTVNLNSLNQICPTYIHDLLENLLIFDKDGKLIISVFNDVGYDLARALSLIYETPIVHHLQKYEGDIMYNIVIKCAGDKGCNFSATFQYDYTNKMLILLPNKDENQNIGCSCKYKFDNIDFLQYTLLNPKLELLKKISGSKYCYLDNIVLLARSLIPIYAKYLKDNSTLTEFSKNLIKNLSSLNLDVMFPKPIIEKNEFKDHSRLKIDVDFNIKWKELLDYLFFDCEVNGNDFELFTNSSGDIVGIFLCFTKTLSVFNKDQNFNIHLKEVYNQYIDNFNTYVIMGELSNNKVHALSMYISKREIDDDYSLFMKSTLMKLAEPYQQLSEQSLNKGNALISLPKRISYFCENHFKQILMFDKLKLSLQPKNDYILIALVKAANNIELNAYELKSLKMFEFNSKSSYLIDDCINYGVIVYYKELSNKHSDFFGNGHKGVLKNYRSKLPKVFKLLYDDMKLVKKIVESKYGINAATNISENDIKFVDNLYRQTRDIKEFIFSLCTLIYVCQYHEKKNSILKVLVKNSFSKNASKISWMFNAIMAQQNVNIKGGFDCKFYNTFKLGKYSLNLHIRDDFGTGSNFSCKNFLSKLDLNQKYSLNNVLTLVRKVDLINSIKLNLHTSTNLTKQINDNLLESKSYLTAYIQNNNSTLKINSVCRSMINNLYHLVSENIFFYNNAFKLLRHEIIAYLESGSKKEYEMIKFKDYLLLLNEDLSLDKHFSKQATNFITEELISFNGNKEIIKTFATQLACKAFSTFLQSFECGDYFKSAGNKNSTEIKSMFFKYDASNRSFENYNCYNTHFECAHKFTKRIDITFVSGYFMMEIINPYKQEDIPIQYCAHDIDFDDKNYYIFQNRFKYKLKSLDRVPELKPFVDDLDFSSISAYGSSEDCLIEKSQLESCRSSSLNKDEKSLTNESDDTIDVEMLTDNEEAITDIGTNVDADSVKITASLESLDSIEEKKTGQESTITLRKVSIEPIIEEVKLDTREAIKELKFLPVLPPKGSYSLNSFKSAMEQRLELIKYENSPILNNVSSQKYCKRKIEIEVEHPRRVLRKLGESAKNMTKPINSNKSNEIESFFLGMDLY